VTIFSASNIDTVILDQFKLDGKVALVTGASAGLGQAIAIALAEAGADVVCHGNRRTPDATLEAISRLGRQTLAVGGDLAKKETPSALVEAAIKKFGRIDILINNAGASWGAPVEEMRLEHWNKVIETNLTGTFLFSQAVGKVMITQRRGKIINIASVAGLHGAPPEFQAIGYHASKGGVISFTRDLACKWGIHNIQVNAIAPGWFPTHMSEVVIERNKETILKRIPLGRFGRNHDLKGAAVFLSSDASDFVTGHVLVVDGGQTA